MENNTTQGQLINIVNLENVSTLIPESYTRSKSANLILKISGPLSFIGIFFSAPVALFSPMASDSGSNFFINLFILFCTTLPFSFLISAVTYFKLQSLPKDKPFLPLGWGLLLLPVVNIFLIIFSILLE
jgi:hypothetical protein